MQSRIVSDATTDIKALKRPDKALPCPRCNSFDTKFCYYNNYNVNQPRHFCKGCQRYWTAGGTLRNVAVGAGRRKRKHTSLESDSVTDDSASEHCNNIHDLSPIEFLGNLNCGSTEGEFVHTRSSEVVKQPKALPSAAASNPLSLNVAGSASYVYTHSRQIAASCNRVSPLCNSRSVREQASTFHEFLHSDHITAARHKKVGNPHALAYESVHLEQTATGSSSRLWADSPRNSEYIDLGSKLVSSTASTRQASNESGCASSVTTLAASVDACATDRQSEAMDSEVAKEGDEVDKGGSLMNETLHSAHSLLVGGASSTSSFVHCDASSVVTRAPMPGPLENPAVGAALPLLSSGLMWGLPADRALFWGFPWGPAAKAVDAAKAALIPQVGLSQKHQQTEQNVNASSEMRLWFPKTVRIKDADEAVRSSIWSTLGIRDRQGSVLPEKAKEAFQCHAAKEVDVLSIQSQYANPAALTQSMAFQESS